MDRHRAARSADHAVVVVDRLAPAVEDSLTVVTQAPVLVAAELSRMTNFIQEQRLAVLKQLTDERIAAVRDSGEIVKTERVALVADMDRISEKAVDQAFWRATQLSAAFALATLIAVVALLFLARRLFANHPPADRRE